MQALESVEVALVGRMQEETGTGAQEEVLAERHTAAPWYLYAGLGTSCEMSRLVQLGAAEGLLLRQVGSFEEGGA